MKWIRLGVAAAGALAAVVPVTMGVASAVPVPQHQSRVTLPPYVAEWSRLAIDGGNASADLGPASAGAPVSARVYLAGMDPRGLAADAVAVSSPGSPLFHHYLSPAQVRSRFGPTGGQVSAVRSWLAASGLHISAVTGHDFAVTGTAAQAKRAFGATWHSYTVSHTTQQAPPPSATLTAPAAAAAAVLTVAPVQTGLPGSAPAGSQAPPATPVSTQAPAVPASPSCSGYFGQHPAASLPPAYGRAVPDFICGYTPAQVRSAYGVPRSLTGKGETVAVIHPWRQATAAHDLAMFGARHGEPLRPGQFTQILPPGLDASCEGTVDPFHLSNEETGDVEAVHDVAPAANIVYVGAKCDNGIGSVQDLDALTTIVDQRLATIVSNSWEISFDGLLSPGMAGAYEQIFEQGAAEGIGFYFAAGDTGAFAASSTKPTVFYPQSDPWVTSVGGTSLAIGKTGNYEWESGWGDRVAGLTRDHESWANLPGVFDMGSGGGASTLFRQPSYQRGVVPAALSHAGGSATAMRVVPDIAAVADVVTGPLFGETMSPGPGQTPTFEEFPGSGTSIATPLVAGMQADVQQEAGGEPIGFANPAIYARSGTAAFHDVTGKPLGAGVTPAVAVPAGSLLGNSQPFLITLGLDRGLTAAHGYDNVTGVGTIAPAYFASYAHQPHS